MAELNYTTRSIRRRRNTDMWEISLSHTNPITGKQIRTYHTVEAKPAAASTISFTEEQLEAMLAQIRTHKNGGEVA